MNIPAFHEAGVENHENFPSYLLCCKLLISTVTDHHEIPNSVKIFSLQSEELYFCRVPVKFSVIQTHPPHSLCSCCRSLLAGGTGTPSSFDLPPPDLWLHLWEGLQLLGGSQEQTGKYGLQYSTTTRVADVMQAKNHLEEELR
ncbi:hypothetical protein XENOCAPTIV_026539 [Xenoophorus captivus]|uniref:Uncharacterized protein n=1 Tax=Xenoophorus captivus TaxID=1517983 RepID=A0ABV0RXW7_9TELE